MIQIFVCLDLTGQLPHFSQRHTLICVMIPIFYNEIFLRIENQMYDVKMKLLLYLVLT